jgi:hypothetical protein
MIPGAPDPHVRTRRNRGIDPGMAGSFERSMVTGRCVLAIVLFGAAACGGDGGDVPAAGGPDAAWAAGGSGGAGGAGGGGASVGGGGTGGARSGGGGTTSSGGGGTTSAGAGGTGGSIGEPCAAGFCGVGQICCGPVQCGHCIPEMSGAFCGFACPAGDAGSDATATPDAAADGDAAADAAVGSDAGCVTGCTRRVGGYCASPQVEWVCSGAGDRVRMLAAGCEELPTGAIRYCCPDVFTQCP